VTAPSNVTRIHAHRCAYVLWVAGKGWISKSNCHFGDVLPLDPPGCKGRAA
jgi:hypothetical protein